METTGQKFEIFWSTLFFAAIFHGISLHLLGYFKPGATVVSKPIQVKINTIPPQAPIVTQAPTPPKVISKPAKKLATKTKVKSAPKKLTQPIQGVNENSVLKTGMSNFSAPIGNTLLIEDQGIRTGHAEELPSEEDLTQGPKLLSIDRPDYTEDALDAGIEGRFALDVLVDEMGKVLEAELKKKIGYGMDERIISAVLAARFSPPTNRFGQTEKNWGEIVIKLELP